jgi:hypothetical protein
MSSSEKEIILTELDGLEALADTVKSTCYKLRERLSGVSTPDNSEVAVETISQGDLARRVIRFRRRLKK